MFKPLFDKVLVEKIDDKKQTESGIILPDSAKDSNLIKGKVIALGSGKRNKKGEKTSFEVKEGEVIIFKEYSADEIKIEEKNYYIVGEENILGIIE